MSLARNTLPLRALLGIPWLLLANGLLGPAGYALTRSDTFGKPRMVISGAVGASQPSVRNLHPYLFAAATSPDGPATQLVFLQQPSNTLTETAISPAVRVAIEDASGTLVTSATNLVRVNLTGIFGLGGTLEIAARKGIATFNNLAVTSPGVGFTLTASSPGISGSVSSVFNVLAQPAPPTATITLALPSSTIETGSALIAGITLSDPAGPTGVAVSLSTSSSLSVAIAPPVLIFAPGQVTATFDYTAKGAGASTLTASAAGYVSDSAQISVIAATGAAIYYVSNSGSDSNDGTSSATAWQSIAKVNSSAIPAGSQVLFQSTGVWHEQLNAKAKVEYNTYGSAGKCTLSTTLVASCTNMPVIDGADIVAGWSVYNGTTYRAPYVAIASKAFVDNQYSQTTPLAPAAGLQAVTTTAGTTYSDGTYVYVHLLDNSNPTNHIIEVSGARAYGIDLGGYSFIAINGLEIIRSAKSGIVSGTSSAGNSISVQNNVFFNNGDQLGDIAQGYGSGNAEGAIFAFPTYNVPSTGWVVMGNWIGESDFPDNTLNYTEAGIMLFAMTSPFVANNEVATVHGTGIQFTDNSAASCTSPHVQNNEVTNSEGNLWFNGCVGDVIANNNIHNSFGNGIEIGGGNDPADTNNTSPFIANNLIHDIAPAYSNGVYNGIDVNHATDGTAIGNTIYRIAAGNLTLEADSGPSSGWQISSNTFDASQNTAWNGSAPSPAAKTYPMYVRDTSLAGGLTMRSNVFVFNAATPIIRWGATSAGDVTHDLTQPEFDLVCPGCEVASSQ